MLLALGGCVISQVPVTDSITGQVTDAVSSAPIAAAHVFFVDFPGHVAVTSPDGRFSLPAIRKWEMVILGGDLNPARTLVVEAPRFVRRTQVVLLGGPGTLAIAMQRSQLGDQ